MGVKVTFWRVSLLAFLLAFCVVAGAWLAPSYERYKNRPSTVRQFCNVIDSNADTGCVAVRLLYESDCDNPYAYNSAAEGGGTTKAQDKAACEAMMKRLCVYSDDQKAASDAWPPDPNAISPDLRAAYVARYPNATEHVCWYPPGEMERGMTFTPPREYWDDFFNALMTMIPILFGLLLSFWCVVRRKRTHPELEDEEMLSGLFDEVVSHKDGMRAIAEEQSRAVRSLQAKLDREQEKRIDFVLEVEKEKKERLMSEDNIKHAVNANLRSMESKLAAEMAARLAQALGKKGERAAKKFEKERLLNSGDGGTRPDSAASIYEEHERDYARRRAALADDIEAQRSAFHKRLADRKARPEPGERREGRERGGDRGERRSKSRGPRRDRA